MTAKSVPRVLTSRAVALRQSEIERLTLETSALESLHAVVEKIFQHQHARVEKYFTRSLRSLVKYFSTLEEKFRISARSWNIRYISILFHT